jgi:hypothetical protein
MSDGPAGGHGTGSAHPRETMADSPIPGRITPAPIDDPPIDRWEVEIGQRRAERLAAVVALLTRSGATGAELARALLPWLRELSDRQCDVLERELDVALADLAEE